MSGISLEGDRMNIEFQIRKRPATLWMHAAVKAAAEAARNGADEAELAACFKPHARIAKRLLTKDWSLRGLAPPELFAALGGDRMSKAEDHYIHHLDFGDLQVDDRSLNRWFRAFLKALGHPQPAPRVERVGDILPLLIEQPPLAGEPGDCFADPGDLDWRSVPRFVLSLAIPGDSKHGVRPLSDSQMIDLVDPVAGVEGFAQSPVCRALALMVERTSGVVPRLKCFTQADYTAIDWDAAPAVAQGSLASLTELLKAHGVPLSAVKANRMLLAKGILEERTRRSRSASGGEKRFKAITEAGERYGINQENPNNPDETSPRWREDRFAELVERYLSSPE